MHALKKCLLKFLPTALLILLLPSVTHAAYFFGYPIYPYLGLDLQYRETPLHKGQGDNIFASQFHQGQLYTGVRFLEYFGLELTLSKSNIKNEARVFGGNNVVLGVFIPPAGPTEAHQSHAEFKSFSANVIGFYPIPFDKRCRTELIASMGVARSHPKFIDDLTSLNGVPLAVPQSFTFDKRKTILRLMAGLQYKLTHNIGLRGSISFEDTSRFNTFKSNQPGNIRIISLKDSFIFGLGIYTNTSKD
ncbi:hypothetical protein CC99x_002780 [Candidatus Berkiella cookevillensis]|uniref:Outer membrane protein beta-barrel domain-containing protein n=1 Tax=Candidatus Berkiella cookevillensis TaxID=437022 RepID=A0A0Q9YPY9_9GAMM|nr:hypothetical protein [Candidatus Berkiella cookevillensis]MCS5707823.1 hypothetical protein [Candidatus Berkiella cookevillensis]